jgi:NAD(P)-dependent dehydrogenase (short-subunit alcohol dehydrogenase family)
MPPGRFEGRTAIVTGGTGGIGSEISRRLASEGAKVVVTGRNLVRGEAVVQSILDSGGTAVMMTADVADDAAVAGLVRATLDRFGSVDVLINNAGPVNHDRRATDSVGSYSMGEFFGPDVVEFDRVMRVGVYAAYFACRHVIPHMLRRGGGAIANISSTAGVGATPGTAPYGMAKAAMNHLTRYVAIDFGRAGVRCNTIVTGLIKSKPSMDELLEKPGMEEGFRSVTAATRFGVPADIASAVAFLCSDEAGYINGAELAVDGGVTARLPIPEMRPSPRI